MSEDKMLYGGWITGKQLGNRLFNLFADFGLSLPALQCPPPSPAIIKTNENLLSLMASGNKTAFKTAFASSSKKKQAAFLFLLGDIIGALRRLPDDESFFYPEPFCAWLDLLMTLLAAKLPVGEAALALLQNGLQTGRLPPEKLRLMENYPVLALSEDMQTRKPFFHLASSLLGTAKKGNRT